MDASLLAENLCSSDFHLPDVLLYDILSRLPSKSLVRFRCVCKSWYSLITNDREFHKLHLLNFNSNNDGPRWFGYQIGARCDYDTTNFWVYDETFASEKIQTCPILWEETPLAFYFSRIIGSCNGIVCLYLPVDEELLRIIDETWGFGKFFICMWNPSIRKYRRVDFPWKARNFFGFREVFMMGFGTSMTSCDYKVVVIWKDEHEDDHVYVHSLRTSSWTKIKAKPCAWKYKDNKDMGTFFSGSCHWIRLSINQGDYTIFCFNLDDHNFRYISLPTKSSSSPSYDCFKTFICKDMLSVWDTSEVGKDFAVNIWVMKEYGNGDSWLFFRRVLIKEDYWFEHRYFRLFGIDAGGRLLFKADYQDDEPPLRACDPESEEIEDFLSSETIDIWDMAPYQESLALL